LFDHISKKGCLQEEEAMKYFRQLLSAMCYCHEFKICHRDLKPENLLLTKDLDIKVADFGMAALEQGPSHRLVTSCGSPHYAAPEVIKAVPYRGEKVDVWSMGIILYATLSGRLPFDNPSLPLLLASIQKGRYRMASIISAEAADLIRRMLQTNPRERISMRHIWIHPVIRKYDYLDNLNGGSEQQMLYTMKGTRPVSRRSDIDVDILRHLRSLWHQLSENQVVDLLLNDQDNDLKTFYSLFIRHRINQLENYQPTEMDRRSSDYHHARPLHQIPRLSTRQFSQTSKGHRRQVSRFTVISNAPTDSGMTERSYDPFRASRPQNLTFGEAGQANVVVHRDVASRLRDERQSLRDPRGSVNSTRIRAVPTRIYASRSSLASSVRSRSSNPSARTGLGHKRGVSFNHSRRAAKRIFSDPAISPTKNSFPPASGQYLEAQRTVSDSKESITYIRSKKSSIDTTQTGALRPKAGGFLELQDDVRHLSSSLAKDCDEAFNRMSGVSTVPSSVENKSAARYSTPATTDYRNSVVGPGKSDIGPAKYTEKYDTRPLPPRPPASPRFTNADLGTARKRVEEIKANTEKRATSAPIPGLKSAVNKPLPSNKDTQGSEPSKKPRVGSAPDRYGGPTTDSTREAFRPYDTGKVTARIVPPSSPVGAKQIPPPLDILRASQHSYRANENSVPQPALIDLPLRSPAVTYESYRPDSGYADEHPQTVADPQTLKKKKSSWFKRSSKTEDDAAALRPLENTSSKVSESGGQSPKKKGFGFANIFKKRTVKQDDVPGSKYIMNSHHGIIATNFKPVYALLDEQSVTDHHMEERSEPVLHDPAPVRRIEAQQNWLARLFNVKPEVKYMCFSVTRKKARQEIMVLLKDWRQYGIRDLHFDRQQHIIFAKVASKNCKYSMGQVGAVVHANHCLDLSIKEVSFAIELMTVIEHNKRSPLTIARLTQESGAASSFHKVFDTIEPVLRSRGILVADQRKAKMMIKTLTHPQ
jgi:serine/threonine protein kinase